MAAPMTLPATEPTTNVNPLPGLITTMRSKLDTLSSELALSKIGGTPERW